jgi:hypothetical protein
LLVRSCNSHDITFLALPSLPFSLLYSYFPNFKLLLSSIYLLTSPTPQHPNPHPHPHLLYPQILRLEHQERLDAQKAYELKGTLGGRQSMMNAPQVMRSVRGGNHGVSAMDVLVLYCVLDAVCVCVYVCVCVCVCVQCQHRNRPIMIFQLFHPSIHVMLFHFSDVLI